MGALGELQQRPGLSGLGPETPSPPGGRGEVWKRICFAAKAPLRARALRGGRGTPAAPHPSPACTHAGLLHLKRKKKNPIKQWISRDLGFPSRRDLTRRVWWGGTAAADFTGSTSSPDLQLAWTLEVPTHADAGGGVVCPPISFVPRRLGPLRFLPSTPVSAVCRGQWVLASPLGETWSPKTLPSEAKGSSRPGPIHTDLSHPLDGSPPLWPRAPPKRQQSQSPPNAPGPAPASQRQAPSELHAPIPAVAAGRRLHKPQGPRETALQGPSQTQVPVPC